MSDRFGLFNQTLNQAQKLFNSAFELALKFAILLCQDGLDLSDHFAPEKELGNQDDKLEGIEKGEKEEEEHGDEEGGLSNKKLKPSIWMVSTQVVFLIPLYL